MKVSKETKSVCERKKESKKSLEQIIKAVSLCHQVLCWNQVVTENYETNSDKRENTEINNLQHRHQINIHIISKIYKVLLSVYRQ